MPSDWAKKGPPTVQVLFILTPPGNAQCAFDDQVVCVDFGDEIVCEYSLDTKRTVDTHVGCEGGLFEHDIERRVIYSNSLCGFVVGVEGECVIVGGDEGVHIHVHNATEGHPLLGSAPQVV